LLGINLHSFSASKTPSRIEVTVNSKFAPKPSGLPERSFRAELRPQSLDGAACWLLILDRRDSPLQGVSEDSEIFKALAIIENAALILDGAGVILHTNPAATSILGYLPEDLVDQKVGILFDTQGQSPEGRLFLQDLLAGTFPILGHAMELSVQGKDGQLVPVEVRLANLRILGELRTLMVMKDLRRRKMNEERLILLSSAVEQAPAGILIADLKGVVEYVNDGFTKLTGYATEEVVGRNLLSTGSVIAAFARNVPLCWRILSSREWQGEVRGTHRNGADYAALVTFSSIIGPNGDAIRLLGRFQDTTHQVRDQEALAESEQRFSEVAKLVGEWLWEQDEAGFFTYSSEAVHDILGYQPQEIIGRHYQELMTESDRRIWARSLPPASRVQLPFHRLTNHYLHRDGHEVFTESSGTPLFDERGRVVRWRGVDRDITARKLAEDRIRLRERAIEAASVGIVVSDATLGDNPIIYANSALSRITGYAQEDFIGKNLRMLQGRGTDEMDRETIRNAILSGSRCEVIIRNYRKDGQAFWNELQLSPVLDEEGRLTHYIGVITDVTERRRAETETQQLNVAREIQLSLLPKHPVLLPDLEVAGVCIAATQVGGDYYDMVPHGDYIDLVVADVSGHSVGAALIMAEMRSTLKAELRRVDPNMQSVGDLLAVLNELLMPDLDGAEMFITMFYMRYQRSSGILRYASAGHNPALLLRKGATACEQLNADGLIMGVNQQVVFEEKSLVLGAGDRILVYTDGAVETQDALGAFYGTESLEAAFLRLRDRHPEATLENLLDDLREFGGDARFNDDVTMAVFVLRE
jgi:sigma-B regulation protein RsbU (phosphoserine phosphatase)